MVRPCCRFKTGHVPAHARSRSDGQQKKINTLNKPNIQAKNTRAATHGDPIRKEASDGCYTTGNLSEKRLRMAATLLFKPINAVWSCNTVHHTIAHQNTTEQNITPHHTIHQTNTPHKTTPRHATPHNTTAIHNTNSPRTTIGCQPWAWSITPRLVSSCKKLL